MNSHRDKLFEFIQQLLVEQNRSAPLTPTTELIESQILDSVSLVKLILIIQQFWNVEVNFADLDKKNFKDIATIFETIERLGRRE